MLNPMRHHSVTNTTVAKAGPPSDCHDNAPTPTASRNRFTMPVFWSNTISPISPVATPEITIGTMMIVRNTGRAGRTEFSNTASPSPIARLTGTMIAVNNTVLNVARQKSASFTSVR